MKLITATLLFSIFIAFSSSLQAQARPELFGQEYENPVVKKGFGSFGVGIGLPYGGLGARIGYNVADKVNLFTGLGYNLLGLGFNMGLQYDFATINRTSFYLSGMGGYNAVTVIEGASEYNKTFYGPSFGLGIKMDSKKASGNFWQFGVIVPVRSAAFADMVEDIKNDPRIEGFIEPFPVLIVVGYNMGF